MGQAILNSMAQVNDSITEQISNAQPGAYKAYVFGGAAVHIHTNHRGSADIDVELSAVKHLDLSDIVVMFEDEDGEPQILTIDPNFTSTISGILNENYEDNAILLWDTEDSPLKAYVVAPLDLAVSKLDRLAQNDQDDILALFKRGCFTADRLEEYALEALSYAIGEPTRLHGNIEYMVSQLRGHG